MKDIKEILVQLKQGNITVEQAEKAIQNHTITQNTMDFCYNRLGACFQKRLW